MSNNIVLIYFLIRILFRNVLWTSNMSYNVVHSFTIFSHAHHAGMSSGDRDCNFQHNQRSVHDPTQKSQNSCLLRKLSKGHQEKERLYLCLENANLKQHQFWISDSNPKY